MTLLHAPSSFATLVQHHGASQGNRPSFTFLEGSAQVPRRITFEELDRRARQVARRLASPEGSRGGRGVTKGDRVLVMYPAGLDYVTSLIGCFYAGAVAVPTYPPSARHLSRSRERIERVVRDAGAAAALGTADDLNIISETSGLDAHQLVGAPEPDANDDWQPVACGADDAAILQYTSGSTAAPKGIVLTHGNVLANEQQIREAVGTRDSDVVLSWLPPFHDMGLLGGILHPLFAGIHGVLMAPDAFIRRPARWLQAATDYRASILVAPNFAYELCVRRIARERRDGFDLSAVRVSLCGAEPISPDTLTRFAEAFAPQGFPGDALYPCYGLAEASIFVTGARLGEGPRSERFEPHGLDLGLALPSRVPDAGRGLVSCGVPGSTTEIAIVDPTAARALPERNVGEVWVRGPSVARGYWNQSAATAETFGAQLSDGDGAPYLRTGDLGFMHGGELYVTGRLKDVIIIRGRNHYPQDLERTLQQCDEALVADGGAAFSIAGPKGERLVIVQELDRRTGVDAEALLTALPDAIAQGHDVAPYALVLIKRGTLPKTASGKVRRAATREQFEAGTLVELARYTSPAIAKRPPSASGENHAAGGPSADPSHLPARAATLLPPPLLDAGAAAPSASLVDLATVMPFPERDQNDVTDGHPAPSSAIVGHSRAPNTSARDPHAVEAFLRRALATRTALDPAAFEPDVALARYGIDSLTIAELTEDIEIYVGRDVPTSFAYENATLADLTAGVLELAGAPPASACDPAKAPSPSDRPAPGDPIAQPIAVLGMGCRVPGARSPEALWQLLLAGRDAISAVPDGRWQRESLYDPQPGKRGRMCSDVGGFLEDVDRFDAAFFGISQREAERMDPRQRLLLEVAWEALENAGIDPHSLAGSQTGVFIGATAGDYATLFRDLDWVDADFATGNANAVLANRLSYFLDLRGPSVAIDSACASSLSAVHAACEALITGSCDLALVGGVNVLLAAEPSISLSHARALSPTGRCRAFSHDADGFVRAEGVGVVVLQRSRDANAHRHPVRALIAGTAVNHNGHSQGLMAPNGAAQRQVIGRALARAGLRGGALGYVEAHGVGAPVADAIELESLGAVTADAAREAPCWVGSIKTNLGHLEAAAGVVSLIKTVLVLEQESIPPSLHYRGSQPKLDLPGLGLSVPTRAVPWRRNEQPRVAGVSAFGFGGANAHVVLREAPTRPVNRRGSGRRPHLAVLSARTPEALHALASALRERVGEVDLGDLCHTLNTGRARFAERAALVVQDASDLREQLRTLVDQATVSIATQAAHAQWSSVRPALAGERPLRAALPRGKRPALAVAFGDQVPDTSTLVEVWHALPWAREIFIELDQRTRTPGRLAWLSHLGLTDEDQAGAPWPQAEFEDVCGFAWHWLQWRLARELRLTPVALLGWGRGELAAACAAGVLDWCAGLSLAQTRAARRTTAAQPAPRPEVDPLAAQAARLTPQRAQTPVYLASQLQRANPRAIDLATIAPIQACDRGPHPELGSALSALALDVTLLLGAAPLQTSAGVQLPLLASEVTTWRGLLQAAGELFVRGVPLELSALDVAEAVRHVPLPTYPFARQRCWLPDAAASRPTAPPPAATVPARRASDAGEPSQADPDRDALPAHLSGHPLLRRSRVVRARHQATAGGHVPESEGNAPA